MIVWFRNDLRLADHAALAAAVEADAKIFPVYILEETVAGRRELGGASKWWLDKSLRALAWLLVGFLLLIIALIVLLRFVNPPTSTFMLGHLFSGSSHELRHEWVSLDEISPWVPLAVVASEDQRFPYHQGVDFSAIRKALAEYRAGQGLRGASTITQQTAKNLFKTRSGDSQGLLSKVPILNMVIIKT